MIFEHRIILLGLHLSAAALLLSGDIPINGAVRTFGIYFAYKGLKHLYLGIKQEINN